MVRSAELEGLISIRGDKDVHGSFGKAFLLLLTVPSVPPPEKNSTLADTVLVHVPREFLRSSRSSNSTSASSSDLRRVRSRMSSHSAWIRSSLVRLHCGYTPVRKDLRGSNIIGYTVETSRSHPRHFQPTAIRVRRSILMRGQQRELTVWLR